MGNAFYPILPRAFSPMDRPAFRKLSIRIALNGPIMNGGHGSQGQVIYEMHLGTFTAEGTYAAAARQLTELARIGITMIEILPVADFPGRFGWGYDGVNMFAPTRLYGQPDDLRQFVDAAHRLDWQ